MPEQSGTSEAVILVKASPQVGQRHGETVCCAGVDENGQWVRLYPVSFRKLDEAQQFGRWDRIKFKWRKPENDSRPESLRVEHESIEIIGQLKPKDRLNFLGRLEVTSIKKVAEEGRTLALLRPKAAVFSIEPKTEAKISEEREKFAGYTAQKDLFNSKNLIPLEPCPFVFKYKYETDDGQREGTCQDWETDATFFNWRRQYGQKQALDKMQQVFGIDYPSKGMVFAMGTHSQYPDTWLINGIVRLDEIQQMSLGL